MSQPDDLIAALADIDPDSGLAHARQTRHAATRHAQGSYNVLFDQGDDDFPLAERRLLAAKVAGWHARSELQTHYQPQQPVPDSDRISAALDFAHRLTFEPVAATPAHLETLKQAGWTPRGIVTLAQLVAFVSFQSRLITGLRSLQGHEAAGEAAPVVAGHWHEALKTASGKTALTAFTQQELGWEPWLPARPLAEFSEEEQATLAKFGHTDSDYFRLLGRNLPLLEQRTLTDKGIFYTAGGLPRAERELAATVVSKVNGCIYCASVHARKASQLSKQDDAIQKLLNVAPGAVLSHGHTARWQAIIAFSAALSLTPSQPGQSQIAALREQGLDTLALLDLIQSTAFFAWANRLMLTLGEPFLPEQQG
ncbi:alkylhydroperoxidase domain protein [Pantoea sp. Bo_2]|uniref:Alkylhydroperoxidase domain protein n=1 Tax=Candidatus Pantoea gossypiicola TaxID=2608008 RepID=A0AB34CKT8_9GAMM|nr:MULTISPECIES: alkylhydroperoxidase domain protein [Pantoea]KAA5931602.1 alkylhydroperoxidase domain protein [Pantoea sp. VH_8]KAA5936737.1 alkylhydroperoxidase domain protein [Pantoea sp. VH_4]KAA5948298.1 alkylhydroperoxidase domain protein [Pantoea sp. VH_3]KAA5953568.1 alkylhydroperoxidase domain protein [Pantoea sp. VH_25]KAA5956596.1 alkylhydroperoxidase domain protein [Pantoea sp. VH_24]